MKTQFNKSEVSKASEILYTQKENMIADRKSFIDEINAKYGFIESEDFDPMYENKEKGFDYTNFNNGSLKELFVEKLGMYDEQIEKLHNLAAEVSMASFFHQEVSAD